MQKPNPAGRPTVRVRRPLVYRTSDRDFDFGAPLLPDDVSLPSRWHARHAEEERGLRFEIYRELGFV